MNLKSISELDITPPLWMPKLLDKPSAWWGHVPFAFWITSVCKPRVFVELGTHYGVSYAAFCEAILRLRLVTRSYAVDTWAGDEQAGFYPDNIFNDLSSLNGQQYSAFSELLRMPFDEANERFNDGTIDLLHIDGYHAYEAVAHDFNLWLPKLSRSGVVLFHDTNVHKDDFGVWRFFEELSKTTPCFEFLHGFGLGIACIGAEAPEVVQALCRVDDDDTVAAVRERFSQLGAAWASVNGALLEGKWRLERIQQLGRESDEKSQAAERLEARLDEGRRGLEAAAERISRTEHELAKTKHQLAKSEQEFSKTERELAKLREQAEHELVKSQHELVKSQHELVKSEHELAKLRERAEAESKAATARISSLNEEHAFLARNLSRTYHRPWRPLKHRLSYDVLRSLSTVSAAFSERRASRFAHSAQKRDPSRFDLYLSDTTDPLPLMSLVPGSSEGSTPASGMSEVPAPLLSLAETPENPTLDSGLSEISPPVRTFAEMLRSRFLSLEPLRVYQAPHHGPRVTLVTDSINKGSLYGGVATAIILAVLIARRLGADLRLVTRDEPPDAAAIGMVLRTHGVAWDGNVECLYSPSSQEGRDIPLDREDLFVTTSWWTTRATRSAVPSDRIVYMLGEDERLFYPTGDDYILCAETLSDPDIFYAVNSSILFDHLQANGFAPGGVAFEPAFSKDVYYPENPRPLDEKRQFFFYGRPNNSRNLYWRGVSAIAAAIEEGIFDPDTWDFNFVGKDMSEMVLPRGIRPRILNDAPREEYIKLVRRVDVGLSLIYTPHPSYPPFDLAACGAIVVTNRFGSSKVDLSRYSPNILCVDPSLSSLVGGLRSAVELAANREVRFTNVSRFAMPRDWETAFTSVVELVAGRFLKR